MASILLFPAVVLCAALAAVLPGPGLAQEPGQDDPEPSRGWRLSPALALETNYDSNVFLLDRGKRDDLSAPSASDRTSGRLAGMESASDVITALRVRGDVEGSGLAGRRLELVPEIRYEHYALNQERSRLRLALSAIHSLGHGGRISLEASMEPEAFTKNYLADATDLDASGSISPDERLYRPGRYGESEVTLAWRTRLARSHRDRPFGAKLELAGGYSSRRYDTPFQGRDLDGPTGAAGLLLDLGRRASVDVSYGLSVLAADEMSEVLLLDEPDFGQDLNGDGDAGDLQARTVQTVDRSRSEHSLRTGLDLEMGNGTRMRLFHTYRLRDFSSELPLDVVNRGRRDTRNSLGLDVSFRMAHGLRLAVGGELARQTTNRPGDPGSSGEEDDYTRARSTFRLTYVL